jgi:hypothetical protein
MEGERTRRAAGAANGCRAMLAATRKGRGLAVRLRIESLLGRNWEALGAGARRPRWGRGDPSALPRRIARRLCCALRCAALGESRYDDHVCHDYDYCKCYDHDLLSSM